MLETALEELADGQVVPTFLEPPVTLTRLEAAVREGYHILHYLGHGSFNQRRGQAALYLQDDAGNTQIVRDEQLGEMLARQGVRPRLVFLGACQSATQAPGAAFSGLAQKLVQVGVPAVVAMQNAISIETTRVFSRTFYARLAEHGTVDLAMNEARSTLVTGGRLDAAVPVLFMRLEEGEIACRVAAGAPITIKEQPMNQDSHRTLKMARRALATLEERAAGYGSLNLPTHLQIQLEDKRTEVARLEAQHAGSSGNSSGRGMVQVSGKVGGDVVIGSKHEVAIAGGQVGAIGDNAHVVEGGVNTHRPGVSASATLRGRLQRLDDVQIDALCMDHFPDVYDTFARGLRRDEKINLLLDHCRRHNGAADKLAALLK